MNKSRLLAHGVKFMSAPICSRRERAAGSVIKGINNNRFNALVDCLAFEDKEMIKDSDDYLFSHYRTPPTRRMVAACARVERFLDEFCGVEP